MLKVRIMTIYELEKVIEDLKAENKKLKDIIEFRGIAEKTL